MGFSNDPLLQGRLFSYLDTQISRLGGPNFHQLPVNAPRCPFHNQQRDGMHQMEVPKGRANYEPNSIDPAGPRENPVSGYRAFSEETLGEKTQLRTETFADHYSQARMFYRSMTEPEQRHMASALGFELAKVELIPIRTRMLGHLALIDPGLQQQVEGALGMQGKADKIQPAMPPRDLEPSDALSLIKKAAPTLAGRKFGVLITNGFDASLLAALRSAASKEKAAFAIIAPKVGGATDSAGKLTPADFSLSGAPSVFFDTVAVLTNEKEGRQLAAEAAAVDWVRDAFGHLKVIAHTDGAKTLLEKAAIQPDEGIVSLKDGKSVAQFIKLAKNGRVWKREPTLRSPG
jgi:catalase